MGFSFLNSSVLRSHKRVFLHDHQKFLDICFTLNHIHVDSSSSLYFSLQGSWVPQVLSVLLWLWESKTLSSPPWAVDVRWAQVCLTNSFTTGCHEHSGYRILDIEEDFPVFYLIRLGNHFSVLPIFLSLFLKHTPGINFHIKHNSWLQAIETDSDHHNPTTKGAIFGRLSGLIEPSGAWRIRLVKCQE